MILNTTASWQITVLAAIFLVTVSLGALFVQNIQLRVARNEALLRNIEQSRDERTRTLQDIETRLKILEGRR